MFFAGDILSKVIGEPVAGEFDKLLAPRTCEIFAADWLRPYDDPIGPGGETYTWGRRMGYYARPMAGEVGRGSKA